MREVAIVAVAGALLMVVALLVHFLPVSLNDGVPLPATLVCRTNRARRERPAACLHLL